MYKDRNKLQKIQINKLKRDKNNNKSINFNKRKMIIDLIKVLIVEIIKGDSKKPKIRMLLKIKDFNNKLKVKSQILKIKYKIRIYNKN